MYGILVAAFVAALITASITPGVRRWSEKIGAVDKPSARRANEELKPRAGGVAICLGFLIAVVLTVTVRQFSREGQHTWTMQVVGVLVAVLFAAIVGLVDDIKDLSPLKQILGMVVLGFSNAEIAAKLYVSESTVKSHLSSAFATIGVRTRKQAAALILDPGSGFGTGILAITDPIEGSLAARDTRN